MQDEARKDSELRGEIKKKHGKNSIEAELNYAYWRIYKEMDFKCNICTFLRVILRAEHCRQTVICGVGGFFVHNLSEFQYTI